MPKPAGFWGYYILPNAWLVENPLEHFRGDVKHTPNEIKIRCSLFGKTMYEREFANGLHFRADCDGLFFFDFRNAVGFEIEESEVESLDFHKTASFRLERSESFNAHIICLRRALFKSQNSSIGFPLVNPYNMVWQSAEDKIEKRTTRFRDEFGSYIYGGRSPHTYIQNITSGRRIRYRQCMIKQDTLELATRYLEGLIGIDARLKRRLCALYNSGLVSFQNYDYPTSLMSIWVVVEQLLEVLWSIFIEDNRTRDDSAFINSERRRKLSSTSVYTASVKIEILNLNRILSLDLYEQMEKTRKLRNKWMHEIAKIEFEDVVVAAQVAGELFKIAFSSDVFDFTIVDLAR